MDCLLIGINAKYIHTNLAVRYLYTYTNDQFSVDFKEFTIKDELSNILDYIQQTQPKLVGFSCYIWNIEYILELVQQLKQQEPTIQILLGGPEVSYDTEYFLSHYPVDFIISGEGEHPFKLLLEALRNNYDLNHIPQLHYTKDQTIYHNNMEYIIDFNALPSPHRLKRDEPHLKNRIQYIESSRGCPYHCSYCLASLEKRVRQFNPEIVKEEIRYLMKKGAKIFKFLDRTFNIRKDFAINLFDFIINEHFPGCVFQFEITGDLLDEDIIHYLNERAPKGLIRFEIGVQSTNDLTNQLVLRKQNTEKLIRNIKLIQAGNKIDLHLDLIAGLPKEDYTSFQKTFNDIFVLKPHELQLGFLKMLRGTLLRNEAAKYNYEYDPKPPYEVIKNDSISNEELDKIRSAEFILDKYYNPHRFDQTLNYILDHLYKDNYYSFFEQFGIYWLNHYPTIDYQLHDLCTRLMEFIKQNHPDETSDVQSLLIYDYLKNQNVRPKIWYERKSLHNERHAIYQQFLSSKSHYTMDQLFRYGHLDELTIHPFTYEKGHYYLLKLFLPHDTSIYILTYEFNW